MPLLTFASSRPLQLLSPEEGVKRPSFSLCIGSEARGLVVKQRDVGAAFVFGGRRVEKQYDAPRAVQEHVWPVKSALLSRDNSLLVSYM